MRVVVTTGRTEESLTADGVALTNGFTGLQGQEIARAFVRRGADVTVISGPTALPDVENARTIHVRTMRQMQDAVLSALETHADIYVSAAAIADFSLDAPLSVRLSPGDAFTLNMRENPSIVAAVARHPNRPKTVVSFAAQSPGELLDYALRKFEKSGADLTVANPIGAGRDPLRNEVYFIFSKDGKITTEKTRDMNKADIAEAIAEKILNLPPLA